MLYVPSITGPFTADIVKGDPKTLESELRVRHARLDAGAAGAAAPQAAVRPHHGDRPEQGRSGVDGAERRGPRNHPLLKPLNLPPLGNPGRSAPLVTKTLLFVGEGSPIMAALGSRLRPEMNPESSRPARAGKKFRAYDKATGAMLWETELPAGTTGAPMTYMFDGKQYIVVAVGSREASAEFVALSLP